MGILRQILTVDIIKYIQKHYVYLITLCVLAVLYISNGLIYDLEIDKHNRLENSLLKSKTRYNMKLNEFMEFGNYRNIINLSNKYNLGLEAPDSPPVKVENESEESNE
ncbi:MAG: hypothetical protein LBQ70_03475 [Prevotellaceae bacterium]|jgi:hypothetical protein|nr:hypothetical protein [Prevotellaceae bacterium]